MHGRPEIKEVKDNKNKKTAAKGAIPWLYVFGRKPQTLCRYEKKGRIKYRQTLAENESVENEKDQRGNRQKSKPKLTKVVANFDLIFGVRLEIIRVA